MADKIEIEIVADDKSKGAFASVGNGIKTLVGSVAGVMAAKVGFDVLKTAIVGSIGAANESALVAAQTESVIKSTGGAAGVTAGQVGDLASALSKVTPFDDEVIQSAENIVLTFTNIGKDVFPEVTETALNMSQALGQDTKSSAIQLGKALNDPIKGVTALQRVGVTFTDQQKEQIKTLIESGDVMGAQKVILQELNKEFGGSARAAGQTFGGQLAILKTQLGNVQEAIGVALVPVLASLASKYGPMVVGMLERFAAALPGLIQQATVFGSRIATAVLPTLQTLGGLLMRLYKFEFVAIRDAVLTFIAALQGDWTNAEGIRTFHSIVGQVGLFIRNVIIPAFQEFVGIVQRVAAAFQEGGIGAAFQALLTELQPLGQQLLDWAASMVPVLLAQLAAWGQAFIDWVAPYIPPLLAALGGLLAALGAWLLDPALPLILAQLAQWGQAFIAWVAPQIGPLLTELGGLLAQLGSWLIGTALPAIIAQLSEWGAAFVAWVAPQIGPLLSELGSLLASLGGWLIGTALPAIISNLAQWGEAFIKWVAPQIPPLLEELVRLMVQVDIWMLTVALPKIIESLIQWGRAFVEWVAKEVIPKLPGALAEIVTTIASWTQSVQTALAGYALDLGAAFVRGFISGMGGLLGDVKAKAAEIANAAKDAVANALGISSPSKLMIRYGAWFVEGLAIGMDSQKPRLNQSLSSLTRMIDGWAKQAVGSNFSTGGVSAATTAMTAGWHAGASAPSRTGNMGGIIVGRDGVTDIGGRPLDLLPSGSYGHAQSAAPQVNVSVNLDSEPIAAKVEKKVTYKWSLPYNMAGAR